MPVENVSDQIECPICGKMSDLEMTSCPNCGHSFYPEDEMDSSSSPIRSRSEGLVLRVVAFVLIGALLGGGLSLVVGTTWVWLTIVGGIIVGLLGMIVEERHRTP